MVRAAIPKHDHNWLDPDTVVSPGSWDAALRAAGAALYAVDQVMAGKVDNAFCAVRPPGHHAEPSRAMGFCLFNNVAIAALHARAKPWRRARGRGRFRRASRQRHASRVLDRQGSVLRLDASDAALSRHRRARRDRRRQYLQCAAEARRRQRSLPRRLRDVASCRRSTISRPTFSSSPPASMPISATRWRRSA